MAAALPSPLRAPTARGRSCAETLAVAIEDIFPEKAQRPEVIHIVGASEVELSMDFDLLAKQAACKEGASIVLIGPHALRADASMASEPEEEKLLGPFPAAGGALQISIFPHSYQRYLMVCSTSPAPELAVLFHPGLDIHYFTWYPCIKFWADRRIPMLATTYNRPEGTGETPQVVETILESLLGRMDSDPPGGLFVMESENPHRIEDGSFNAAYFAACGSGGSLPAQPEEMYFPVFQALQKMGYPFAPRVGYLDVETDPQAMNPTNSKLLAAIAEGALRAARSGEDGCDEETAQDFAMRVLDEVLGPNTGLAWKQNPATRQVCPQCQEGFDSKQWHRSVCPAMGINELKVGDKVTLARLPRSEENGLPGTLKAFDLSAQEWVVEIGGQEVQLKPWNLDLRKK